MVEAVVQTIFSQYQGVVSRLNLMFTEIDLRSEVSAWRRNGIGSCTITQKQAEKSFRGPARARLIAQVRERDALALPRGENLCSYHRVGSGCTQGDLKNPLCISFIDDLYSDSPKELQPRFGIDSEQLHKDIVFILNGIMEQDPTTYARIKFFQSLISFSFINLVELLKLEGWLKRINDSA